jgi:hypothetical protein
MKDIVPSPPPVVRNDAAAVQALFQKKCRAQLRAL